MLSLQSKVKLANGVEIPRLGLGVYQSPPGRTTQNAVKYALSIGYRHVDTASLYGNEEDVGIALRERGSTGSNIYCQSVGSISRDLALSIALCISIYS